MIADRIAIYSVLLPLFILSPSGLSPPQRLPQWLRSSKRAMNDGRRERRKRAFSSLFPLPIAPRALSFFPLPSLPTTQGEESPLVTVPYSSARYLPSVTKRQFVGSGETSFCRAVSQDPTHTAHGSPMMYGEKNLWWGQSGNTRDKPQSNLEGLFFFL